MSTQEQDFQWTDKLVIEFAVNWMKERVAFAITNDLAAAPLPIQLSVERFKDEKVEKRSPEYEVLELICNNTAKTTWERNKSVYKDKEEWVKCFLNANIGWAIHSVRRLSDGEVFTLGDSLDRMLDDCPKIDAFLPNHKGNQLWLSTNKEYGYGCALNHATKLPTPKPLFTTEDGVDIHGGEKRHLEYEILSFVKKEEEKDGDIPFVLQVSSIPKYYKLEDYLKEDSCFAIHSVKRLSDGEVFQVGDEIDPLHGEKCRITGFEVNKKWEGSLMVRTDEDENSGVALKYITKLPTPTPLFTTEDGVDTYEGQDCWVVDKGNEGGWNLHHWEKACKKALVDGEKYFHFYSNAEAWVEAQKPKALFTTEDGVDIYEGGEIWQVSVVSNYAIHKTVARPELFPAPSYFKYFSKQYNAELYALENKVCLSAKEVFALTAKYGYDMMALENDVINLAKAKL